jgi:hypothetical protein
MSLNKKLYLTNHKLKFYNKRNNKFQFNVKKKLKLYYKVEFFIF